MWVIDTSAVVELLLTSDAGRAVAAAIGEEDLFAPQLLAVEAVSVMRRLTLGGMISEQRAVGALEDLKNLGVHWMDIPPLTMGAWRLRHNASAYDGLYIALADSLDCQVLTCDERLTRASDICVLPW